MSDYYYGKRLMNLDEFMHYTSMNRVRGKEWAKEIGAMKHIGRRVFFDRVIIDRVLDEINEKEA